MLCLLIYLIERELSPDEECRELFQLALPKRDLVFVCVLGFVGFRVSNSKNGGAYLHCAYAMVSTVRLSHAVFLNTKVKSFALSVL